MDDDEEMDFSKVPIIAGLKSSEVNKDEEEDN